MTISSESQSQPVTEADVVGSHRKVETAEPEAAGTTACEVPDVAAPDTTGQATMLPRIIQMVMRVVPAGIMAHPLSTGMYVRSIGMSCLVVELAVFLRRRRSGYFLRTALRNVLMTATDLWPGATCMFFVLRQG